MHKTEITPIVTMQARKRLLKMHFESGVGHIGGNLSCLDAMLVVHHEYMDLNDRFILSKGHSAGALYITLWSLGRLSEEQLTQFHKDDTLLPGHPPSKGIEDILFATGSLGHGLSLAAGTALGMRFKNSPGRVFCLTSDGEWQEGSTWEALIFSAHHKLSNLTILVDQNGLQGFGSTDEVASMSQLARKISGFEVEISSINGHDVKEIREALNITCDRPRIIILDTKKGRGVKFMEDRIEWHYLPLNDSQYETAIEDIEGEISNSFPASERR